MCVYIYVYVCGCIYIIVYVYVYIYFIFPLIGISWEAEVSDHLVVCLHIAFLVLSGSFFFGFTLIGMHITNSKPTLKCCFRVRIHVTGSGPSHHQLM